MVYKADPITMQVIRYAMEQVADEMGRTLVRTGRSTIIKEIEDITCAVFDKYGNTVGQAHHAPMLLTGFELPMRSLRRRYKDEELDEGDVIIFNDPYAGAQHVMDLITFAPVHYEGQLVGFVGSIAHHSDMGGAAPGGTAGGLTEIYLEGLRFPFVKLYKKGQEDEELFGILRNNIRVPDKTLGDIRAQASACFVGVRRMQDIFAKYGVDVVQKCQAMLLDYSEKRIREGLNRIPDGTYTGVDHVDDDGQTDTPIKLQVNIHKKGDECVVDFEGTALRAPRRRSRAISTARWPQCTRQYTMRSLRSLIPTSHPTRAAIGLSASRRPREPLSTPTRQRLSERAPTPPRRSPKP
jgi:N-methylhydantoinase B